MSYMWFWFKFSEILSKYFYKTFKNKHCLLLFHVPFVFLRQINTDTNFKPNLPLLRVQKKKIKPGPNPLSAALFIEASCHPILFWAKLIQPKKPYLVQSRPIFISNPPTFQVSLPDSILQSQLRMTDATAKQLTCRCKGAVELGTSETPFNST